MTYAQHNQIVAFIWGIADDVLRDVYVRGKYRDAILPMMVLRRLDALLEPGKDKVLKHKKFMDEQQIWSQDQGLRGAAGLPFYNTSPYTLRQLLREPAQLKTNFETYLDGFSQNVVDIINKFALKQQLGKLEDANRLYLLIEKFVSPRINLSPLPIIDEDGIEKLPALSNSGMGSIFEELIRRFNEENNEEAGEHFTPRDIVALMTRLVFEPIQDVIAGGTYLIYDDACGSGGMLTEAENTLHDMAEEGHKTINVELYGQEVNAETFAICQADILLAKLPAPEDDDLSKDVLNAIDMDCYRAQKRQEQDIALVGDVEITPVPAQMGGMAAEPELERLSNIVRDFNERFGTDWTDADQVRRFLFEDLPRTVSRNPEYQSAREHSDTQNARITYEKKLVEAFQGHVFDQTELYRKFAEDPQFKKWLADTLFGLDVSGRFDEPNQSSPLPTT